jgi:hypothetical protein
MSLSDRAIGVAKLALRVTRLIDKASFVTPNKKLIVERSPLVGWADVRKPNRAIPGFSRFYVVIMEQF